MAYTVPTLSIVFMAVSALAGIAIPTALFILFRKNYRADIMPFFIGCAVFIVFALLAEGAAHQIILTSGVGKTIQSNIWLYGAYGGLMAGLFEESGRYTAFKTVLKRKRSNDGNALMYGAGHGGFEAAYILGVGMISNIVMSVMLNSGMAGRLTSGVTDAAALQKLSATFAALSGTAPAVFLMSVVERIAAVVLHISLSVLVWFAAKDGGKRFWLFPLALLLHAAVDAVAVIMSKYISSNWIILGAVYIFSAGCALIAAAVWKKCAAGKTPSAEGQTTAEA